MNNYIVTIVDHCNIDTTYMVRVLAARSVDEAKIKAFAWYFECPEDEIELDGGGMADHTIEVTVEEDVPTVC